MFPRLGRHERVKSAYFVPRVKRVEFMKGHGTHPEPSTPLTIFRPLTLNPNPQALLNLNPDPES